ncbi:MAG: S49 family peptidase [Actinomycetota bacterium]|nr:S49 family peptidase [Actinomycetota bacterium]
MKSLNSAGILAAFGCRTNVWALHERALAALAAAARGDLSADDLSEQFTTQAARGRETQTTGGVAVIPLRGLITPRASYLSYLFGGGGGLQGFRSQLREAVGDADISAIVLDIDSPGGSTDLLAETAAELRAAREVKPIVAVANTWAASAAYWLAAQGDELVVTPTGEVGSVGVFMAHEDWSKFEEDFGVNTTLISAGKYKTEGNRFEPLSNEARETFQAIVDYYYDLFTYDVGKGRSVAQSVVKGPKYGEGRMVLAKQAVAQGMADRVETLEQTIARVVKNPARARRRAEGDPAPTETVPGTPEPNASEDAEEATARPSQAAIDVMFAPAR